MIGMGKFFLLEELRHERELDLQKVLRHSRVLSGKGKRKRRFWLSIKVFTFFRNPLSSPFHILFSRERDLHEKVSRRVKRELGLRESG